MNGLTTASFVIEDGVLTLSFAGLVAVVLLVSIRSRRTLFVPHPVSSATFSFPSAIVAIARPMRGDVDVDVDIVMRE